jgi:hypothetical protein
MSIIPTKLEAKDTGRKGDAGNLLILVCAASVIGIYLIATTVLISKDGVFYIERSQKLSSDTINIVKTHPPGYPFLIFTAHKLATVFGAGSSALVWVYSAQAVSLLCRVLSLIPLYFIGKLLVGSNKSFWATLILIILPYPAQFGSDVLREWPHVLFLSGGFLMLLLGAKHGRCRMFGAAGFAAGLGHMIRPECAQLVIYGVLWILLRLLVPKHNMNKRALLGALAFLLLGFAIPVTPYMAARGHILPEKLRSYFILSALSGTEKIQQSRIDGSENNWTASIMPGKTVEAVGVFARDMSDNLLHYFVPALLIGVYVRLRQKSEIGDIEKFFIPAFVLLNVMMMIMLYRHWGYISRRHCLPLTVMLIFYVPAGLEILAKWIDDKFPGNRVQNNRHSRRYFFVLLVIGVGICTPKLIKPLGAEKRGYRAAAQWLMENTRREDTVAVPDSRISFYAERIGLVYKEDIPENAKYVMRIVRDGGEEPDVGGSMREEISLWVDEHKKSRKIVLYKVL